MRKRNAKKETAHISYLISYYLFHPLTPPHSEELGMEFALETLKYDDNEKYHEWIEEVKGGN